MAQPRERQGFEVFCGVDVAGETHHAVALDRGGRRLADADIIRETLDGSRGI
jgi:hypothetical protein